MGDIREKIQAYFPGAVPLRDFVGPAVGKTMVGLSACVDELQQFQDELYHPSDPRVLRKRVFNLGGLAGVPFSGYTGVKVFLEHAKKQGADEALIIVSPHVGLTHTGHLGRIERGEETDACCGSALGALAAAVTGDESENENDHQQNEVKALVRQMWAKFEREHPDDVPGLVELFRQGVPDRESPLLDRLIPFIAVQLTHAYFATVVSLVRRVFAKPHSEYPPTVTVIGGVQVNVECSPNQPNQRGQNRVRPNATHDDHFYTSDRVQFRPGARPPPLEPY